MFHSMDSALPRRSLLGIAFLGLMLSGGWGESCQAQADQDKPITLTLEISPDPRGAIGSQQQWMRMLQQVGADRVSTASGRSAVASIDEKETSTSITIRIKGFISRDRLELPGGKFTIRDTAKIRDLLRKFREDGGEVTLSEKKAFGLTAKQLVWIHAKLAKPVKGTTKGRPLNEVAREIVATTGLKLVLDNQANAQFRGANLVTDELEGLSAGTALAAALRPYGLALVPVRKQAQIIELHVRDSPSAAEQWPVGWPPKTVPVKTEPRMFERMPITIKNFPLDKVLVAVQKKAQVPFLVDQNSLARKGIELAEVKVTALEENVSISKLMSQLLRQSKPKMSHELRVDEQGKAFVWISSR